MAGWIQILHAVVNRPPNCPTLASHPLGRVQQVCRKRHRRALRGGEKLVRRIIGVLGEGPHPYLGPILGVQNPNGIGATLIHKAEPDPRVKPKDDDDLGVWR